MRARENDLTAKHFRVVNCDKSTCWEATSTHQCSHVQWRSQMHPRDTKLLARWHNSQQMNLLTCPHHTTPKNPSGEVISGGKRSNSLLGRLPFLFSNKSEAAFFFYCGLCSFPGLPVSFSNSCHAPSIIVCTFLRHFSQHCCLNAVWTAWPIAIVTDSYDRWK